MFLDSLQVPHCRPAGLLAFQWNPFGDFASPYQPENLLHRHSPLKLNDFDIIVLGTGLWYVESVVIA